MARRKAEANFRKHQWEHRYDNHIAPINRMVDELRTESTRGWAPYVAPMYGGIKARLLSVLRDTGPLTQDDVGSDSWCNENDDSTAEALCGYFGDSKISADDIVPWNIYPWHITVCPMALNWLLVSNSCTASSIYCRGCNL